MKEQSQIDEMRAAIRGDLERSRARRPASVVAPPGPQPEPDRDSVEEPPVEAEPGPGLLRSLFRRR
jgi:hypothetical protein